MSLPKLRLLAPAALAAAALTIAPAPGQAFAPYTPDSQPAVSATAGGLAQPRPQHSPKPQPIHAQIRNGVYTVDGMVAKLQLNYDVQGAPYVYLFVPGVGTAVVSMTPDANSVIASAKLSGTELAFTADGHRFVLTGFTLQGEPLLHKHLYVRLDRSAWSLSREPMVGFGARAAAPYEWPGALPPEHAEETDATVPPVPASLLPVLVAPSAPGQPSAAAPVTLRPVSLGSAPLP